MADIKDCAMYFTSDDSNFIRDDNNEIRGINVARIEKIFLINGSTRGVNIEEFYNQKVVVEHKNWGLREHLYEYMLSVFAFNPDGYFYKNDGKNKYLVFTIYKK